MTAPPPRPSVFDASVAPSVYAPPDTAHLDSFTYDDAIVRKFLIATFEWGLVGMSVGLLIALQLANPVFNTELPWLSFGRLSPLHTNAVIFAYVGNALSAGCCYSSQRLLEARMDSDFLSRFHSGGWQAIIV